jgi:hypothetical protein
MPKTIAPPDFGEGDKLYARITGYTFAGMI